MKSTQTKSVKYTIVRNDKGLPVSLEFVQDNQLSSTCSIEYDAAGNIVKMLQDNGYFIYKYDGSGKPIAREMYRRGRSSPDFVKHEVAWYTYNEQDQIDSLIVDKDFIYDRFEYDQNGNVSKIFRKYFDPEVLLRENLTFDDRKNPLLDCNFVTYLIVISPIEFITGLNLPWTSDHNVLSYSVRLANGTMVTHTFSFEYNDLGFPVYCKETDTYYSYDCK